MEIVKIDLVPSGVMPSCHASQYDIGREIRFLLTDGGEEYTLAGTETISIELRKPDGTSETIAIPNTSSNYVDWETSDGELDLSGVYLAEISIKNGDDVLGSANFIVKTEADAYDGADVRTITVGPADICTFETTLPEPLQSVIVDIEATGGNGTPDNPNPINGYSAVNLTACGVNLWDEEWEVGTFIGATLNSKNFIKVAPSISIYLKTTYAIVIVQYDVNKTELLRTVRPSNSVYTLGDSTEYIKFYLSSDYGTTYNNDISINYPATDTEYHAFDGGVDTIAFGQTVYGGVLDVTRGKLKPCIEYPSYDGETLSGRWLSSEATYVEGTTPPTGSQVVSLDDYGTDIDLTPEVISAVVGENNVFADCGETTVKYLKAGD